MVQRVAFRLRVRPERLAEYKQLHQDVWPELLDDMRAASIRNYAIFADGPELFGYLECDDWDAATEALARSDERLPRHPGRPRCPRTTPYDGRSVPDGLRGKRTWYSSGSRRRR